MAQTSTVAFDAIHRTPTSAVLESCGGSSRGFHTTSRLMLWFTKQALAIEFESRSSHLSVLRSSI
jgi:hypothetical protein